MRHLFNKDNHPSNEDLITSLLIATQFLNPEIDKEEMLCAVLEYLTPALDRKKLLLLTDEVCNSASKKFDEIQSLYEQFQLTTDINN